MYRAREGQWAFALHRISGLLILLYLLIHVVSISLVLFGANAFTVLHDIYGFWLFRVGLIAVTGGVLYHGFNGLRVAIMDFTGWGTAVQRQLWYGVLAISLIGLLITAWVVVPRILAGH
jgi:succinate dehydrogenase / fumarate reductase cytochrome b subunit